MLDLIRKQGKEKTQDEIESDMGTGWLDFSIGTNPGELSTAGGGPTSVTGARYKFSKDSQDRWYMDLILTSLDYSAASNNAFYLGELVGIQLDTTFEGPSTFASFTGGNCNVSSINGTKTIVLKNTGGNNILIFMMTSTIQSFSNQNLHFNFVNVPLEAKPAFLG